MKWNELSLSKSLSRTSLYNLAVHCKETNEKLLEQISSDTSNNNKQKQKSVNKKFDVREIEICNSTLADVINMFKPRSTATKVALFLFVLPVAVACGIFARKYKLNLILSTTEEEEIELILKKINEDTPITSSNTTSPTNNNMILSVTSSSPLTYHVLSGIPPSTLDSVLDSLSNKSIIDKKKYMFQLRDLLICFQEENNVVNFVEKDGLSILDCLLSNLTGNSLSYTLMAIQLISQSVLGIRQMPLSIIQKILGLLKDSNNSNIIKSSLSIVSKFCLDRPEEFFKKILLQSQEYQRNIFTKLVGFLNQSEDVDVDVSGKKLVEIIDILDSLDINGSLRKFFPTTIVEGHRVQIYLFQRTKMSIIADRSSKSFSLQNPYHQSLLAKLWKLVFPSIKFEDQNQQQVQLANNDHWKLLGFQSNDPQIDLKSPPGILGLENLVYLLQHYNGREYPIIVAGNYITLTLIELFNVHKVDFNSCQLFPILISHIRPMEEIYCIAFQIFDITWDTLNASITDFPKVLASLKKQFIEVLDKNPATLSAFQSLAFSKSQYDGSGSNPSPSSSPPLSHILSGMSPIKQWMFAKNLYSNGIPSNANGVNSNSSNTSNSSINGNNSFLNSFNNSFRFDESSEFIQKIRSDVKKDIYVKTVKGKPPYLFIVLNQNQIEFNYSYCIDTSEKPNNFSNSIKITDLIVQINETPIKKKGNSDIITFQLGIGKGNENVELQPINNSSEIFNFSDGIKILSGKPLEGVENIEETKNLESIEAKIRLLDYQVITIGKSSPPIPIPPSDYDFYETRLQKHLSLSKKIQLNVSPDNLH
eukprot:gene3642-4535_t